jgi:hypothetical protein
MRKLVPILAIAILLPQVALAAWWNPFSWKVFHKTDNTQVLENRVKELEKKLEQVAATSSPEKKQISQQSPKPTSQPKTQTPASNTGGTNYSQLVSFRYNSAIKLLDLQIDELNIISNDADRYIDGIPPLASKARAGASLYPKDADFWNLIADTYSQHRNNIYEFKQTIDNYTSTLEGLKNQFGNKAITSQNQFFSMNEADSVGATINDQLQKIESSTKILADTYDKYTDAFLQDKEDVMTALEISINNMQSSINEIEALRASVPTYVAPRNTNCFYFTYSGGGTINCSSY